MWRVKTALEETDIELPPVVIRNGDLVRLEHIVYGIVVNILKAIFKRNSKTIFESSCIVHIAFKIVLE